MSDLSRRSLVASAAALPALAVPVVAVASVEPDPVYAAIEKSRIVEARFLARSEYEDEYRAKPGVRLAPDPDEDGEYGRTSEMVAAVDASIASRQELANTVPTTLPGLVAHLDYVLVESAKLGVLFFDGEEETLDFIQSLWRSATALAVQS